MPVAEVARQMLEAYPREFNVDRGLLVRCIEACYDCAESCTQCADDCLGEENVEELTTCIRLNLDCADICATTGRVVGRRTGYDPEVTSAMLSACIPGVPQLRRRVRDPRRARDGALQGVRRGVPSLRAGVRRAARRDHLSPALAALFLKRTTGL